MNADCIWRSISIQHVQIEAGVNSDPGNDSFGDKIRDAKHVDRSTHYSTCSSTQVKIALTDLWPQEVFTFSEMLALVESESSFGAYVCHKLRRPGGSTATSDLVDCISFLVPSCGCMVLLLTVNKSPHTRMFYRSGVHIPCLVSHVWINIKGEVRPVGWFWVFDGNRLLGHRLIDSRWFEKNHPTESGWKRRSKKKRPRTSISRGNAREEICAF